MFFMPPGSAKTTYLKLFAAWIIQYWNGARVLGASHTSNLAEDISGGLGFSIQTIIRENQDILGYHLLNEARELWYTSNRGSYRAAGVGVAIPGYRSDISIIDDPVKGRKEADSETGRKIVWEWYNGSLERRRTPNSPVVITHTRWHEDDLAGRLIDSEKDQWRIISLPAEAEEDDLLGRQPGEFLWEDDDYGYASDLRRTKEELQRRGATREWQAQFQQRPRPYEGAIFKVGLIRILPTAPAGGIVCRAWDLASTELRQDRRDPDWTRGVKLRHLPDGRYIVEDVRSLRAGPDEVKATVINTARQDGRACRVGLWQDPGQAGKAQALDYTKSLAGYTVDSQPVTGDKETYASPVVSQCNVGNLYIVDGGWNREFLDELAGFPFASHDDIVDALSRAFEVAGLNVNTGWNITGSVMRG